MKDSETQVVKMSHITTINLINSKLGKRDGFDELNKMSITELEEYRDELIKQYNFKLKEDTK